MITIDAAYMLLSRPERVLPDRWGRGTTGLTVGFRSAKARTSFRSVLSQERKATLTGLTVGFRSAKARTSFRRSERRLCSAPVEGYPQVTECGSYREIVAGIDLQPR
jgi:hypothetical protein